MGNFGGKIWWEILVGIFRAPCTVLVLFVVMASTLGGLSQAHHERVLELLNEREGDQFEDQDEDEPDGDGDGDGDSPTGCMAPARRPWRRSSDAGKGACGDDVDVPPAEPATRPAATTKTAALFDDDDVPVAVRVTDEFEMLSIEFGRGRASVGGDGGGRRR